MAGCGAISSISPNSSPAARTSRSPWSGRPRCMGRTTTSTRRPATSSPRWCARRWRSSTRSRSGAPAMRCAISCTSRTSRAAACWRWRSTPSAIPINIGYGSAVTIRQVVDIILEAAGHGARDRALRCLEADRDPGPAGRHLQGEAAARLRAAGFRSRTGLRDLVRWYAGRGSAVDVRARRTGRRRRSAAAPAAQTGRQIICE